MHSHDKTSQYLAIGLAALAGFVDALGFLSLGGFFVSFMSGNSTRFAVEVTGAVPVQAMLVPLAIISLFVIGVMIGRVIRHYRVESGSFSVLCFMAVLLSFAALLHTLGLEVSSIPLIVLAMGAANNVFMRDGEVSVGVTYMTGTLVKLGQRLAGAMLRQGNGSWVPYLLLWLGLVAGAVSGAVCFLHFNLLSLWGAAVFCWGLALLTGCRDVRPE